MLTLPEIARSRYLLHHGLCDAGFNPIRAAHAVDVLMGPEPDQADDDDGPGWDDPRWDDERWTITEPEPFEPSEEDLEEYGRWSDQVEAMSRPWPAEYPATFTDDDLTAAGLAGGLGASWALTRWMKNLLYGVGPTDPATFSGVIALFTVVAAAACFVPAWRASRLDPIVVLR